MRAGQFVAPDTHPHDAPASRCKRACCWTPLGHSTAATTCTCHEGGHMADRTPRSTLLALDARDGARRCVMTGTEGDRIVPQHRQGGMGGRKDKHRPENVVWADSLLNGLIEADAEWQATAKAWGVKVPIWVRDVTAVPVYFRFEHDWFVLNGAGRERVQAIEALDMMLEVYGDEYLMWKAVADETARGHALYLRGGR